MTVKLTLGLFTGVALTWLALVAALLIAKPKGGLLKEALRLLPDVIRLLKRLATDQTLPRGVRIRLGLLFAYLAFPLDLPRFHPRAGLRRRRHHRRRRPPLRGPQSRTEPTPTALARHPRRARRSHPTGRTGLPIDPRELSSSQGGRRLRMRRRSPSRT